MGGDAGRSAASTGPEPNFYDAPGSDLTPPQGLDFEESIRSPKLATMLGSVLTTGLTIAFAKSAMMAWPSWGRFVELITGRGLAGGLCAGVFVTIVKAFASRRVIRIFLLPPGEEDLVSDLKGKLSKEGYRPSPGPVGLLVYTLGADRRRGRRDRSRSPSESPESGLRNDGATDSDGGLASEDTSHPDGGISGKIVTGRLAELSIVARAVPGGAELSGPWVVLKTFFRRQAMAERAAKKSAQRGGGK